MYKLFRNTILGSILLTILYWLFTAIIADSFNFSGLSLLNFISNGLIAFILGVIIVYNRFEGLKISIIVFLCFLLSGQFNILVEALIFDVSKTNETIIQMVIGFLTIITFSPIYVFMYGKNLDKKENYNNQNDWTYLNWSFRILSGNFLYVFIYLLAGFVLAISYPKLIEFYQGKVPDFKTMILTQVLLRGFIFVFISILLVKSLNLKKKNKAIVIGLFFSIVGGIAPLIPDNELMPLFVRLGHMIEAGLSNFVFGFISVYLFEQKELV